MGARQYSEDLPQGGLEIPCKYVFKTVESTESEKARAMIEDILAIKISTIIQEASIEEVSTKGGTTNIDEDALKDCDLPVFLDGEESCKPPPKKGSLAIWKLSILS